MSPFKASASTPLSRATGKRKLLVAIPGAAFFGVLWELGVGGNIAEFLALALCAYAFVGLLEVVLGESLSGIAKRWDTQPGWKRFLVSVVVIVASLVGVTLLIPVLSSLL